MELIALYEKLLVEYGVCHSCICKNVCIYEYACVRVTINILNDPPNTENTYARSNGKLWSVVLVFRFD